MDFEFNDKDNWTEATYGPNPTVTSAGVIVTELEFDIFDRNDKLVARVELIKGTPIPWECFKVTTVTPGEEEAE